MRCDERTDGQGQAWWFVFEQDTDQNQIWMYQRPNGAARAEYYLADVVWDWLEQNCQPGEFMAWPALCAVAFTKKSQAMLFRLTWDNAGPYKR